jgi:hypothetical protein
MPEVMTALHEQIEGIREDYRLEIEALKDEQKGPTDEWLKGAMFLMGHIGKLEAFVMAHK